jgi:Tol biopolymer transport system component
LTHPGKSIAYRYQEGSPVPLSKLAVLSAEGSGPPQVFLLPINTGGIGWAPDSKVVQFNQVRGGVSNLWEQLISGGAPHQLTNFTEGRTFSWFGSRDGNQLFLSRGQSTSDVVLFTNFR